MIIEENGKRVGNWTKCEAFIGFDRARKPTGLPVCWLTNYLNMEGSLRIVFHWNQQYVRLTILIKGMHVY